jgi:hypothetical protein
VIIHQQKRTSQLRLSACAKTVDKINKCCKWTTHEQRRGGWSELQGGLYPCPRLQRSNAWKTLSSAEGFLSPCSMSNPTDHPDSKYCGTAGLAKYAKSARSSIVSSNFVGPLGSSARSKYTHYTGIFTRRGYICPGLGISDSSTVPMRCYMLADKCRVDQRGTMVEHAPG